MLSLSLTLPPAVVLSQSVELTAKGRNASNEAGAPF